MEDFNPDEEPKEAKGEEEEESDLVGQNMLKYIATKISIQPTCIATVLLCCITIYS